MLDLFAPLQLKIAKHADLSEIQHCYKRNLEPELRVILSCFSALIKS